MKTLKIGRSGDFDNLNYLDVLDDFNKLDNNMII